MTTTIIIAVSLSTMKPTFASNPATLEEGVDRTVERVPRPAQLPHDSADTRKLAATPRMVAVCRPGATDCARTGRR